MYLDDPNKVEILHSLGWVFYHQYSFFPEYSRERWRSEHQMEHPEFSYDVPRNSRITSANDDDPQEVAGIFSALGIMRIEPGCYDPSVSYQFTFEEETLRAHLNNSALLCAVHTRFLVSIFLREASSFSLPGAMKAAQQNRVWNLPIVQHEFKVSAHFRRAVDALCGAALCERVGENYQWCESIRPMMEFNFLWFGDKTVHEVREAELIEIWDTMPLKFRNKFTGSPNNFDALTFATVMGYFWFDRKWSETPRTKLDPDNVSLQGGHLPDALAISRLYLAGKLRY